MFIEPPQGKKPKPEQNDPSGKPLKFVTPELLTAMLHKATVYRPLVVIDCHMHIQSGNCATLPFLWKQTGPLEVVRPGRKMIIPLGILFKDVIPGTMQYFVSKEGEGGQNATELQKELYRRHKFRDTNEVAKNSTFAIGKMFAGNRMKDVIEDLQKDPFYKDVSPLTFCCVVLTMDMEYAHLDGYYGIRVCNPIYDKDDPGMEKDPVDYWHPLHGGFLRKDDRTGDRTYVEREKRIKSLAQRGGDGRAIAGHDGRLPSLVGDVTKDRFDELERPLKELGIPGICFDDRGHEQRVIVDARVKLLGKAETKKYEPWKKQVYNTELAVMANPLRLLPLYHYDPRRWQTLGMRGNELPFAHVGTGGLFLGFKIYTAQGYRPWDPRLPILKDFYRRCCIGEIPIVNHCTPGGAPTFDLEKYRDFSHLRDTPYDEDQKKACPDPVQYFKRHFVSPEAWREVLNREVEGTSLRGLRLCLAHFGGEDAEGPEWAKQILSLMLDYPNVYADLSYSFASAKFRDYFKKTIYGSAGFAETIRHRILFGTDWYLTMLDGVDYREFFVEAKKFLDGFDTSLWLRFTQANPYAFFRIDGQIRRIAENIIKKRKDDRISKAIGELKQDEINQIQKEAEWIEKANGPYRNYEETR
ncbi:MAG: amidohydrolase family protein [Syntrophaceae bacterium]|nr:amidohydrolase family protein [Syntrophaceae bacterium]